MKRILPLLVIILFSCNQPDPRLDQISWIEGSWVSYTNGEEMHEKWTRIKDKWVGVGYSLKNNDTLFTEDLEIVKKKSDLYYNVIVNKNAKPVSFKNTKMFDNMAVFENLEHDFPQRIIYLKQIDGSIHARIEGIENGKDVAIDFLFRRAN